MLEGLGYVEKGPRRDPLGDPGDGVSAQNAPTHKKGYPSQCCAQRLAKKPDCRVAPGSSICKWVKPRGRDGVK
jgi:hypothetical protein